MKLDRLLAIVMLLVNRKIVQAKDLAEIFEVSVRTIYRDVDAINRAGIPVVTYQGVNGGLGIAENYKIDRNVFTADEIVTILRALKSVSTSFSDKQFVAATEKIKSLVPQNQMEEVEDKSQYIILNLSPWGTNESQQRKVASLKRAIEEKRIISFHYTNALHENAVRRVEPMALVLKIQTWYLRGFCLGKNDLRLFRLSRMKDIQITDEYFVRRSIPAETESFGTNDWYKKAAIDLVLKFHPQQHIYLEERFGIEHLETLPDGSLKITLHWPENEWVYGMILSFGPDVEVLAPEHIRAIIRDKAEQIRTFYME